MTDSIIRLIRQGQGLGQSRPVAGTSTLPKVAQLVVLEDSLDTVGGERIFSEGIMGRLEHLNTIFVCIDRPPKAYEKTTGALIVDCCSDPCGVVKSMGWDTKDNMYPLFASQDSIDGLMSEIYKAESSIEGAFVVAIDGLSHMMHHFGPRRVAIFLQHLRNSERIQSVVVQLHGDLHERHEINLVCQSAACWVCLEPGWGLMADDPVRRCESLGRMIIKMRKTQGCKKTEIFDYWIDYENGMRFEPWKPVSQAKDVQPMEDTSYPRQQDLHNMIGGMRLDLSEQEQKAKTDVVLPYEHQGKHSSVYHTNDFRDYLPPEAGGHGNSLGHILYVRDSDSEEYDSDEDPDDDLDI